MPASRTQTPPRGGADLLLRREIAERLAETRERTLALVTSVSEEDLDRVHDPLMSPLAWDLGHIAAFEDLWLCRRAGGIDLLRPDLAEVYDAAETPRARRGELPYLRAAEVRDYMRAVRERSMQVLEEADLSDDADPLNGRGLVWEMIVQHEQQHNETMLQTLKLAEPGVFEPRRRRDLPPAGEPGRDMVRVDAGSFPLGTAGAREPFVYDNERPAHEVELPPFAIDATPVSNGAYREFVENGGYERREWWSDEGWAWKTAGRVERPLYWTADGRVRSFERLEPLDPELPVMHVSWYEADAYARAVGKRLPTEAEWEKAASWGGAGEKRRLPWGDGEPAAERANLDQTAFGPAPVGAHPDGASPCGALGMLGDAWEWTASDFSGYPGFRAFPYREYSEVFFGDGYKVLRGGSWATRPRVIRNTFRNWDLPQRRQIFAGFRCAADG